MPITTHKVTILRRTVNTALLSCAVIAAAASMPTAANAAITGTDNVTVTIDKRDLQTNHGIARVYDTLSKRAEVSCGVAARTSLSQRNAAKACADDLLLSFVKDIGHSDLTQYHWVMSRDI